MKAAGNRSGRETARLEFAALFQQGMSRGCYVRLDALQVSYDVELKRAGITHGLPGADLIQLLPGNGAFKIAETLLLRDEPARRADILEHQHGSRELQVLQQLRMHAGDVVETVLGQAQMIFDSFRGKLHQVLVDDVADMLQIDGEGENVRQP